MKIYLVRHICEYNKSIVNESTIKSFVSYEKALGTATEMIRMMKISTYCEVPLEDKIVSDRIGEDGKSIRFSKWTNNKHICESYVVEEVELED